MATSMTGYGKGEAEMKEGRAVVEIRTVNHRFIDFSITLPPFMLEYEQEIKRIVKKLLNRGYVTVSVAFDSSEKYMGSGLNRPFLRKVYHDITEFAKREDIPGKVNINNLISMDGAFGSKNISVSAEKAWRCAEKALGEALRECVEMRRREGEEMKRDIVKNLGTVEKLTERIDKRAPMALNSMLKRAKKKLGELIGKSKLDDSRWEIEAAALAERSDFSEELARLKSHILQLKSVLKRRGEVSKRSTFIVQEMHREATTMGNKASDLKIVKDSISIKEAVEKIREQVQNLE
jgi:uncharacterized protein (TIGR00255 family)